MNEDTTQEANPVSEEAEAREGVIRQGKRRKGSIVTFESATPAGERPERPIAVAPPPQPKPPYFRIQQAAEAKAASAAAQAEEARAAAKDAKYHYEAQLRQLDYLESVIRNNKKEIDRHRQGLTDLDPAKLDKRFEEAYAKHTYHPFDQHTTNQFLLAGNLAANSKRLKIFLENKIAEHERAITSAEAEQAQIERALKAWAEENEAEHKIENL
jgi:hypothetical protein